MPLTLDDDEIALFVKLGRAVLTELVKAAGRMPPEYWGDLVADLELSEKRNSPGSISQVLHHDSRGIVRDVESITKRRRQAGRTERKAS